jgi:hypothetical protein
LRREKRPAARSGAGTKCTGCSSSNSSFKIQQSRCSAPASLLDRAIGGKHFKKPLLKKKTFHRRPASCSRRGRAPGSTR